MGAGFSPLDEELGLLPGALSPRLQEQVARLGAWMPFRAVARELAWLSAVSISEATACRVTEAAGAAYVGEQDAEATRLLTEVTAARPGPAVQLVSADGAMVPLVGGRWAEVKTLAIGTLTTRAAEPAAAGTHAVPLIPRTTELSYFSRLTDAATFIRLAVVECQRRGTDAAGVVVAPLDGSDWLQGLLDVHASGAVRILDFPHAAEHLATAAHATFGTATPEAAAWLTEQAHILKWHDPDTVLTELRALPVGGARDPTTAARVRDETLGYLEKRRAQIAYPTFLARGYPIGSGSIESANKLVVEARLKGSGMHWHPNHVNPMLALRTIVCSDRWDEVWPRITARRRADDRIGRRAQQQARRQRRTPTSAVPDDRTPPTRPAPPPAAPRHASHPPRVVDGRPTADHPWRRRFLPTRHPAAKL